MFHYFANLISVRTKNRGPCFDMEDKLVNDCGGYKKLKICDSCKFLSSIRNNLVSGGCFTPFTSFDSLFSSFHVIFLFSSHLFYLLLKCILFII